MNAGHHFTGRTPNNQIGPSLYRATVLHHYWPSMYTWPHRPRLAGPTRFQASPPLIYQMAKQSTLPHRTLLYNGQQSTWPPSSSLTNGRQYLASPFSILTNGQTIYLATPSLYRHYITRRPNTISGLTVLQQRWPKQMVTQQILIYRAA